MHLLIYPHDPASDSFPLTPAIPAIQLLMRGKELNYKNRKYLNYTEHITFNGKSPVSVSGSELVRIFVYGSYIYSIYYNCKIKTRAERFATYTDVRARTDSLRCHLGHLPGHTTLLLSSFRSLTGAGRGSPSACRAAATSARSREKRVQKSRRGRGSPLGSLSQALGISSSLTPDSKGRIPSGAHLLLNLCCGDWKTPRLLRTTPSCGPSCSQMGRRFPLPCYFNFHCLCRFHSSDPAHCFHHRHRLEFALSGH